MASRRRFVLSLLYVYRYLLMADSAVCFYQKSLYNYYEHIVRAEKKQLSLGIKRLFSSVLLKIGIIERQHQKQTKAPVRSIRT